MEVTMKKRRSMIPVLTGVFALFLVSNATLTAKAESSSAIRLDQTPVYAKQYIDKEYPYAKDQLKLVDYQVTPP
jgi:hypothetical protein